MNSLHTIFDTRRQAAKDRYNSHAGKNTVDCATVDSAFLAERGEKQPPPSSTHSRASQSSKDCYKVKMRDSEQKRTALPPRHL
jgi:hypothetical protein